MYEVKKEPLLLVKSAYMFVIMIQLNAFNRKPEVLSNETYLRYIFHGSLYESLLDYKGVRSFVRNSFMLYKMSGALYETCISVERNPA